MIAGFSSKNHVQPSLKYLNISTIIWLWAYLGPFRSWWILKKVPQFLSQLSIPSGSKIFQFFSFDLSLLFGFFSIDFFTANLDFGIVFDGTAGFHQQFVDSPISNILAGWICAIWRAKMQMSRAITIQNFSKASKIVIKIVLGGYKIPVWSVSTGLITIAMPLNFFRGVGVCQLP